MNRNEYNCNFRFFARILFFTNDVKIHICDVKNSRLVHDLSTSVNGGVIFLFCEGLISSQNIPKIKPLHRFLNL